MAHLILDTETTSINKPFCYDVGYKIIDDDGKELCRKHHIVEQVWHNLALFESAYYKEKRPLYVQLMRARKASMDKFGYIMQSLARDIRNFGVTDIYAYNSDFDDKVITFNCDWFKCINPLETLPIFDIWGYASRYITNTEAYRTFCEQHQYFTETGNYKASAEVVYRYLTQNSDFEEAHMGVFDVDIETEILLYCIAHGANYGEDNKAIKVLARVQEKPVTIKVNGKIIYKGLYVKKYVRNDNYNFTTRD